MDGYVEMSMECVACDCKCLTCVDDTKTCVTCAAGFVRPEDGCVCPDGTYHDVE